MRDVYIAGVGMTAFGKFLERSVRSHAEQACAEALADASMAAEEVETVFFGNAVSGVITGQEMIRGPVALRNTGLLGVPIFNVENACASGSNAFHLAWSQVASGAVDVAVAIGAEKLTHQDKTQSFASIGTAVDLSMADELKERFPGRGDQEHGGASKLSNSFFMDLYAGIARDYMDRTGATAADFAKVAAKNSAHGALNPKAQYRTPRSVEEILASRPVAPPLTLLMCSPIGDGSAAVVLCSEEFAARTEDPVRVRASVALSGRNNPEPGHGGVERAARRAYEVAGVGPEDLDLVEVHDAAAPAELIISEEIGLCPPGEGAKLVASGATTLGGRVPINPSGGLLSKGHPIGATGCAQLVELVEQLRGRAGDRQVANARIGLAENSGGYLGDDFASIVMTILSK
ncbi:thiolase family protein [Saccharopolyspora karakumensis]|uniref:propanoyl-CoA C-acyltransferase n=1 Tax=Saccharopolyspora karakumensis TaxID=2530386 RepID=A0A4R5BD10_9PSEU|nr:thiolase family protein [Saccharopolyspora karakumensis]TDD81432.1 thiolase family protein [Saccharopolyspora karakumensis]